MRRLTPLDWETINEGLALLEVALDDDTIRQDGESEEDAEKRVEATRSKVHERRP